MNIAIVADIEKAFLQIQLKDLERDVTRFVWLKDISKLTIEDNLQIYRFHRVSFVIISSPFLLNACLRYHLQNSDSPYSQKMIRNMYVDNLIFEADDSNQALYISRI